MSHSSSLQYSLLADLTLHNRPFKGGQLFLECPLVSVGDLQFVPQLLQVAVTCQRRCILGGLSRPSHKVRPMHRTMYLLGF